MKKTLAILAAGVGSRYGGLKQLDTIDDEGHSIIDFSIYDAIQAGFNHIVFIIRKELLGDFKKRFTHLESNTIDVSFVFQEMSDIPRDFKNNSRVKPWGTGHALLSLRHIVKTNFAVINADDFYGRNAFKTMHDNLFSRDDQDTYYMIGYNLKNTLSPYGSVSRGECYIRDDNSLSKIIERTDIKRTDSGVKYFKSETESTPIDENIIVSMNFWGFTNSVFKHGESIFREFLNTNHNDPKSEFYIPIIANTLIKNNSISVKVLSTDSTWYGITYKDDKKHVKNAIANMKESEVYPRKLWT